MKIEVLVSTMFNDDIEKLVREMNIQSDCIVVNQCDCKEEKKFTIKNGNCNILVIESPERGLSKSRNKALHNVSNDTDIVIFTDDDIVFYDNYVENIEKIFSTNLKADGIVFNVRRTNGRLNKKLGKRINQLSLFRVCSVSMTFRYNKIRDIEFDENFGAGSRKYCLGEENIFVSDCLKRKLNIISNDFIMCRIEDKRPSTWYSGMNKEVLISKGASFKRMHRVAYILLIIDYSIRKHKEYKDKYKFKEAIKYLFEGSRDYGKRTS